MVGAAVGYSMAEQKETERLLSGVEGVKRVEFDGATDGVVSFTLHSAPGRHLGREVNALAQQKQWSLHELSDRPLSLEETFLTLTEKQEKAAL